MRMKVVVAILAVVALSSCSSGATDGPPAVVTVTAEPSAPSALSDLASAPTPSTAPPKPAVVDEADGLYGKARMQRAVPTSDQLASATDGLWIFGDPLHSGARALRSARSTQTRDLALFVQPSHCRATGFAAYTGLTFRDSDEHFSQAATREGRGRLHMQIEKYSTMDGAVAELGRWRSGFRKCSTFEGELASGATSNTLVVERKTKNSLDLTMLGTQGHGVITKRWSIRRVGSALLIVDGLSSSNDKTITVAEVDRVAGLMAEEVLRLGRRPR